MAGLDFSSQAQPNAPDFSAQAHLETAPATNPQPIPKWLNDVLPGVDSPGSTYETVVTDKYQQIARDLGNMSPEIFKRDFGKESFWEKTTDEMYAGLAAGRLPWDAFQYVISPVNGLIQAFPVKGAALLLRAGIHALPGNGAVPSQDEVENQLMTAVSAIAPERGATVEFPFAPSMDELRTKAKADYEQADNSGIRIRPTAMKDLAQDINNWMELEGYDPDLHPKTKVALRKVNKVAGSVPLDEVDLSEDEEQLFRKDEGKPDRGGDLLSLKGMDQLRRVVNNAIDSTDLANRSDRRMARIILDHIDDFVDSLHQGQVEGVHDQSDLDALKNARSSWKRLAKATTIQTVIDKAELKSSRFTVSGYENALRDGFRSLALNDRAMRRFSKAEQEAIKAVVQGGPISNFLRFASRFAPRNAVGMLATGLGFEVGGAEAGFGVPVAGEAARIASRALTVHRANEALRMMRRGGPREPFLARRDPGQLNLQGGGAAPPSAPPPVPPAGGAVQPPAAAAPAPAATPAPPLTPPTAPPLAPPVEQLAPPAAPEAAPEAAPAPAPAAAPTPAAAPIPPEAVLPVRDGGVVQLDPDQIGVDAKRFQFKSGGNEQGVTDRLSKNNVWEPHLSGVVFVYRDADGKMWIADGHQRLALAKRAKAAGQPDVFLNAQVFDAKAGWTDADVRSLAAAKNIAEGTGTAMDAAKIIREADQTGRKLPELPKNSALVRDGMGLAKLSGDAWGMMVNDTIPYQQGAIVGRLIEDPAQQAEAIRILKKADPANIRQAEMIVNDIKNMGFEKGQTQGGLFGQEEFASSAILERAKIVDGASKSILKDRKIFRTLVDEAGRIGSAGNVLDLLANKTRLSTDDAAAAVLTKLATRHGPVSDALTALAKRVKSGDLDIGGATRDFVQTLRRQMEQGLERGTGGRGPQSGEESGTQEVKSPDSLFKTEPGAVDAKGNPLPQTIIPGAEPSAAQAAKAREAAAKGKIAPKKQQKEAGPLFAPGEGAGGGDQGTLFVAPSPITSESEKSIEAMAKRTLGARVQQELPNAVRSLNATYDNPVDAQLGIGEFLRRRGAETFHEAMVFYDNAKERVTHAVTSGLHDRVKWSNGSGIGTAASDPASRIVLHHNHPNGSSVSPADIAVTSHPGIDWIVAHGPKGEMSAARIAPNAAADFKAKGWTRGKGAQYIQNVANRTGGALASAMWRLVHNREITAADLNTFHSHFVARMLSDRGLIDYHSNIEVPENVERAFQNVTGDRSLFNQPSGSVQSADDIARLLAKSGESAGQRAEAVPSGRVSPVPAPVGREPNQLTLLQPGINALAPQ